MAINRTEGFLATLLVTVILTATAAAAAAAPAPAPPAKAAAGQAAPTQREDQILIQGIVAGSQTVAAQGTDSVRPEYSATSPALQR